MILLTRWYVFVATLAVLALLFTGIAAQVEAAASSAADTLTSQELRSSLISEVHGDQDIAQASVSPQKVSLCYQEPARLLGLFPIQVETCAIVHNDGSVECRYPWYNVLLATNESRLTAQLKAAAESVLPDHPAASQASNISSNEVSALPFTRSIELILIQSMHRVMQQEAQLPVMDDGSVVSTAPY